MNENAQLEDMHSRLIMFYAQDQKERLCDALLRHVEDPVKPRNERGHFRVNPILLILAVLASLVLGAFLVFSFVQL